MDSKRHGPGIYLGLADNELQGDIYVGEYKFDVHNGQGTYIFKDGSKYKVNEDNNPNGQGFLFILMEVKMWVNSNDYLMVLHKV